jgi:hypothetical protein
MPRSGCDGVGGAVLLDHDDDVIRPGDGKELAPFERLEDARTHEPDLDEERPRMLDMCELPLRVATGCDQDEERDACDDPQCVARETFIVTQPGGPA